MDVLQGRLAFAGLSLTWLLVGLPAQASPLSMSWGVSASPFTMALEANLTWPGSPWGVSTRLGAAGLPYFRASDMGIDAQGNWWTTWGHYTFAMAPSMSLGAMAGVSQSWFFHGAPIPFRSWYSSTQPFVTFFGAFLEHDGGSWWVRLAPSLTVVTPPQPNLPVFDFWEATVLGPPLVEVGFRLDPASAFEIRTSLTPFAYTRHF